jgi:predicted MFS family arabinose efflux permease
MSSKTYVNSDQDISWNVSSDVPDAPKMNKGKPTLILVALCLSVFLAAIDAVIIIPALPTIVKDLGASDSGYSWIGSS